MFGIAKTSTLLVAAVAIAQPASDLKLYEIGCVVAAARLGVNVAVVSETFVTSPVHVPVPDKPVGVTVAVNVCAVLTDLHSFVNADNVAVGTAFTVIALVACPLQPAALVTDTETV